MTASPISSERRPSRASAKIVHATAPHSLFITRNALCPTCGAALTLEADAIVVECTFCGGESSIERRLRTLDAELAPGVQGRPHSIARGDFVPSHEFAARGRAEARCPACGSSLEVELAQELVDCRYCKCRSKVEHQLRPATPTLCDAARLDAELDAFRGTDPEAAKAGIRSDTSDPAKWNPFATQDLRSDVDVKVMLTASSPDAVQHAADCYEPWTSFNRWRECMFTRLLERAESAPEPAASALLEQVIRRTSAAAWQHGEQRLETIRCVVRSAARVIYRKDVSERLLYAVSFAQPNAMLKTLLDLAEWALEKGHGELAVRALRCASRSLDHREGMHHVWRDAINRSALAQVVLYRLLYMRRELVLWALDEVPRWTVDDPRVLMRFVDDCAFERPELVPLIRDARIARVLRARSFRDLDAHLDFLETLHSDAAREFALYLFDYRPEGDGPDGDPHLLPGLLERLGAMLHRPDLRKHAAWLLARIVRTLEQHDHSAIHSFMEGGGHGLPALLWWTYREVRPGIAFPADLVFRVPYEPPQGNPVDFEAERIETGHGREVELLRELERLDTAKRETAVALEIGRDVAASARQESLGFNSTGTLGTLYAADLVQQREAGVPGGLDPSSPYLVGLKHRLSLHELEYDQTGDPRYKDLIEGYQAALAMVLERARMRLARRNAKERANRSWLANRLLRMCGR